MATNFKIDIEPQGGTINLNLSGNFDAAAADELIEAIRRHGREKKKILVNTNRIRTIHPFGQVLFQNKYRTVKENSPQLLVTGKNSEKLLVALETPSRVNI